VKKTLNPTWNESFCFEVVDLSKDLTIDVFDWDMIGSDDKIGSARIPLTPVTEVSTSGWYPLSLKNKPAGSIFLSLRRDPIKLGHPGFSSSGTLIPPSPKQESDADPVGDEPTDPGNGSVGLASGSATSAPAPNNESNSSSIGTTPGLGSGGVLPTGVLPAAFPVEDIFLLLDGVTDVEIVQREEAGNLVGLEGANSYNINVIRNGKKEKILYAREISSHAARAGVIVYDSKGVSHMSRAGQINIELRLAHIAKNDPWNLRFFNQPDNIGDLNWQLELPSPSSVMLQESPNLVGSATFSKDSIKIRDYLFNVDLFNCTLQKGRFYIYSSHRFLSSSLLTLGREIDQTMFVFKHDDILGAVIKRQAKKGILCEGDAFHLELSGALTSRVKMLFVIAAIAIDFMFFEKIPVTLPGSVVEGGTRAVRKETIYSSLGKMPLPASPGTPRA